MPNQNLMYLRPIETDRLTQAFGENQVCAKISPNGLTPVRPFVLKNKVGNVCPVGYKDFYRLLAMKGHNGGDFGAWRGEPVYHCALFKGTMRVSRDKSGALNVDVISRDPLIACTEGCPEGTIHYIFVRYSHGGAAIGDNGREVHAGDHIMAAGDSGGATGVHVHWAPKWCDDHGNPIHENNGYEGAFDYNPSYQNTFILDYLKQQIPPPPLVRPIDPLQPSNIEFPEVPPAPASLSMWDLIKRFLYQLSITR